MEAIVIQRQLSKEEEQQLLEKMSKGSVEIYAAVEVPVSLKGFVKVVPELSNEKKKEINFRIMDKILQFGETLVEGKSITEHLMFDTASIWHYHKFRTYFTVRNQTYETEQIEQLAGKYERIRIYTSNNWVSRFFEGKDATSVYYSDSGPVKGSFLNLLKYGFFFLLRAFIGSFQSTGIKSKKHILIDHAIRQNCLSLETLRLMKGNTYMQYLFDRINPDFLIIDDREIPRLKSKQKFRFQWNELKADAGTLFGEYVLLKGLLSFRTRRKLNKLAYNLEQKYVLIQKNLHTNPDRLIFNELIALHATSRLFLFKFLTYGRFFSKRNFHSVTSIDENSARIKTILDAAKSLNIKTVGVQHGTIHELHPAYLFTLKDVKLGILPDYTMVWGEYWKRFFHEEGNYPEGSVIATGQIRTDIIPRLKESSRIRIPELEGKGRIVIFASQPQRDPKIRRQAAFDVFSAVKNLENVHLVVKLHPAEKNDFDYYRKIAAEAGCENFSILFKIDLYLLMSQSDIMITCFSTVGAETVYFNKPLIILDHLKQDIQGYHREGIALQASTADELKIYVKQLLTGEIRIDNEAYRNYIEKYAYKIDGKVSERIIGFIEGLVKK